MHLHDSTIAHIAKVVQLAIVTGTDVIDHLRMMKLDVDGLEGLIYIDKDYESEHSGSINEMIEKINKKGTINE